jgi:hypothetical protein
MRLRLTTPGTPVNKKVVDQSASVDDTLSKGGPATPGSAPKKQKTSTPTTKEKKESGSPLVPGDRSRTSTFLPKVWQLEGQCAAYLGFAEIQHLRRFAMSPVVLNAFGVGQANTWPTPGTRWQLEGQGDFTPTRSTATGSKPKKSGAPKSPPAQRPRNRKSKHSKQRKEGQWPPARAGGRSKMSTFLPKGSRLEGQECVKALYLHLGKGSR